MGVISSKRLVQEEIDALLAPAVDAGRVGLAVSGGIDSMAMLLCFWQWSKACGVGLRVFTVDHGLRAEATQEAQFVADKCAELGLQHQILRWQGQKPKANIQGEARAARYALLEVAARESGCAYLCLAHHRQDQAETFLSRLARGSGVEGLAAMRVVSRHGTGEVPLFRPFLHVARERLKATLQAYGWEFVQDPSNENRQYERVRLRQSLGDLAQLGLSEARLDKTARAIGRAADALAFYRQKAERELCQWHAAGFVQLDCAGLKELPKEIALRLLASLLRRVGGARYTPRLVQVERLLLALCDTRAFSGCALAGVELRPFTDQTESRVLLCREIGRCGINPLQLAEGESGVFDRRFRITARVPLRVDAFCLSDFSALGVPAPRELGLPWPKQAFNGAPLLVLADGSRYLPWYGAQGVVLHNGGRRDTSTWPADIRPVDVERDLRSSGD
ncbi:tRNA lysidine(34) synthetase TilS [Polycladidibacter hongkongensis]|uniref:tRNA lysidine(34) synthetase TilS n=1 Tax=Polycladidibacter hongkongensis TaxID=1647556 RepID=UPI00083064D0|nr:tRNA lysidine(34) synthetase TilS [Pseudovibrio hongkongensis]